MLHNDRLMAKIDALRELCRAHGVEAVEVQRAEERASASASASAERSSASRGAGWGEAREGLQSWLPSAEMAAVAAILALIAASILKK